MPPRSSLPLLGLPIGVLTGGEGGGEGGGAPPDLLDAMGNDLWPEIVSHMLDGKPCKALGTLSQVAQPQRTLDAQTVLPMIERMMEAQGLGLGRQRGETRIFSAEKTVGELKSKMTIDRLFLSSWGLRDYLRLALAVSAAPRARRDAQAAGTARHTTTRGRGATRTAFARGAGASPTSNRGRARNPNLQRLW